MLTIFQVKSRMMGDSSYKNTFDCFLKTLFNEVSELLPSLFDFVIAVMEL